MRCNSPATLVKSTGRRSRPVFARRLGVSICEQTPVKSIEPASSGAAVHLASGKSILAKTVVIAANAYSGSIEMPSRPAGKVVRNFMVATKPLTDTQLASLAHSDDFVVELNRKYIFYRVHERRLVFGGIDKVGAPKSFNDFEIPGDVRQSLQRELTARLGGDRDVEIEFGWGGRFHMTMTDLPIIERISTHPSVIYNAGYGGTGVALTLALAPVAAALALSQPVEDDELGHVAHVMRETRLPVRGGLALAAGVTRRIFSRLLTRAD